MGVFDPTDDSFTLVDISATISSDHKFDGAAVAGDGRLVFAPFNADGLGVFDPTDDSFTLVDISATWNYGFAGATVAGDGGVVLSPYNADGVGVFNSGLERCTCCESKLIKRGFNVNRECVAMNV